MGLLTDLVISHRFANPQPYLVVKMCSWFYLIASQKIEKLKKTLHVLDSSEKQNKHTVFVDSDKDGECDVFLFPYIGSFKKEAGP